MSYTTTHLAYQVKGIIADPSTATRSPFTGSKCMATGIVYDPPLEGVDNVPQGKGKICLTFASKSGRDAITGPPSVGGQDEFIFLVPIDEEWPSVADPTPPGTILYAGYNFGKILYVEGCS